MISDKRLSWSPDLRLPAEQHALQEFISHENEATLRIILHSDKRARVEVNDQVIAETQGFQNAAAMAELYTRNREFLLAQESTDSDSVPKFNCYYRIRARDGECDVAKSSELANLVDREDDLPLIARAESALLAIEEAFTDSETHLVPAFSDQRKNYNGLGQQGATAILVAIWTSRSQMPVLHLIQETEFSPLFLTISKGHNGTYYTIYRLVNRKYLAELRSQHDAEEIGAFSSAETARAYCNLFNAARHCSDWVSFPRATSDELTSGDGAYSLIKQDKVFDLRSAEARHISLGQFPSVRLAEAYATVRRDALHHFDRMAE